MYSLEHIFKVRRKTSRFMLKIGEKSLGGRQWLYWPGNPGFGRARFLMKSGEMSTHQIKLEGIFSTKKSFHIN